MAARRTRKHPMAALGTTTSATRSGTIGYSSPAACCTCGCKTLAYVVEHSLVRFNKTPTEMNDMHNLLWGLSDLTDADIAAKNLEGMSLRSYLSRHGISDSMIDMACAGYANTVAGTVDTVGVRNAVRMDRTWHQDGGCDMGLLPSTYVVRCVLAEPLAVWSRRCEALFVTRLFQLVEHLSRDVRIMLNWPVAGIDVNKDTGVVRVRAEDGRTLTTNAVIVTVPPPVRIIACCCRWTHQMVG